MEVKYIPIGVHTWQGVSFKIFVSLGAQRIHNHSVSGAISAPGDTWPMWSDFEAGTAMVITIIPSRPFVHPDTMPCHARNQGHIMPWYQENHAMSSGCDVGYLTYHGMVWEGSYHGVAWVWYAIPFHLIASVLSFAIVPPRLGFHRHSHRHCCILDNHGDNLLSFENRVPWRSRLWSFLLRTRDRLPNDLGHIVWLCIFEGQETGRGLEGRDLVVFWTSRLD